MFRRDDLAVKSALLEQLHQVEVHAVGQAVSSHIPGVIECDRVGRQPFHHGKEAGFEVQPVIHYLVVGLRLLQAQVIQLTSQGNTLSVFGNEHTGHAAKIYGAD